MLHQQNSFQVLYEDEFPSLSDTGPKDFTNINISSTADPLSYCAKLKTSQEEKLKSIQTERAICKDKPFYKSASSKSMKTPKQNLASNSHSYFGSQMFLGKLSENNKAKVKDSQLSNLNHADDQELVSSSDQSDEKEKGWVVVKKKTPHLQKDENNKLLNKTKIENKSFLKSNTSSVNSIPLPKHRTQNMQCSSKKKSFSDSKVTFPNQLSSSQNKVLDSEKKTNISNNSKNFKHQPENVESGRSIPFKRVEASHKPKYIDHSNKQSKNISSHVNFSHAVRKERNSSPNKKQYSTNILQRGRIGILNATQKKNVEETSSLSKKKVDHFPKNKTENSKKFSSENDFTDIPNQNKKDLNESLNSNFNENQHTVKPSKKKRKSKIKRLVAMQSDKIRIITPEMYSKIMNSSNEKVQSPKNITVNIFDSNEYPELGSSSTSVLKSEKNDLEIFSKNDTAKKLNMAIGKSGVNSGIIESLEGNSENLKDHDVSVGDECVEQKKIPVHYNNPITISLFDMLSANKHKKKEAEKSKEFPGNLLSSKFNLKKQTPDHHQNVNPLDSSKPAIKRGKEREKPKPKRLSKFKKIILLDRENRKEQVLKQYMWNKLLEEKDVVSHTPKSSEIISEKGLTKFTPDLSKSNVEMQHLTQINNEKELFLNVECGNMPEKTKLLNLHSSLGNNVIISGQERGRLEIKNEMNFLEQNSNFKRMSAKSFVENATTALTSQMQYQMKEKEGETKEQKLPDCENGVDYFALEKLQNERELSNFSKPAQNPNSNPSLINENESNKYINRLSTLCKDISYESSLIEIPSLIENWDSSKQFSEEQNLEEILYDIQNLFLLENETNIFSCKKDSTELDYNFINNVKNNEKTSNNICNLSSDDVIVPEEIRKDCLLSQTVCCNFEDNNKIFNNENSETENMTKNTANYGFHCHSDKETLQAAQIILHSKKFRDYCNHFSSKELGDTVIALLDDLTRFQDRMHQKDPIKARMKRRLIYGIREIKRHLKLKKLKCIIIATDIEDSKTEGSLNDVINDLKALSKDYHVPCVFSHLRKKLGKVCHKPAPVSAVGVLNYEGSEVNFKKMLELHSECKIGYEKVLKFLLSKVTADKIDLLHTTKTKDSTNLYSVVTNLLKELFSQKKEINKLNTHNIENQSEEASFLKGSHINKDAVEITEVNNILIKYKVLN